jgi:rRNA-processing protein FCF1
MTLRVMFDSNAYDAILRHGDAERIDAGMFSIITTLAQEDELHQIADPTRRAALLEIFHSLHAATAEVPADWVVSRDSIIGRAAAEHCDLLVTDDRALKQELAEQAPELGVLTYADFRREFLD